MEEEITNADDYADWLKWVSDAKRNKQAMFESTHHAKIPVLLQVQQIESGGLNNNSFE
jgi:glyoxylate carboligase